MDHFSFHLKFAFHHQQTGLQDFFSEFIKQVFKNDKICASGFIFNGYKTNTGRCSGALSHQNQTGNLYQIPIITRISPVDRTMLAIVTTPLRFAAIRL